MQDKLNIAVFVDYDNIEIGVEIDAAARVRRVRRAGRAEGARRHRRQVRLRQLGPAGRRHAADGRKRRADGAAHSLAARRQERRRHQPGAGRAGDGLHAQQRERLRHRQRRQRLHPAGQQAEGIRQDRVSWWAGKAFTSTILQQNCHEFISYESLLSDPERSEKTDARDRPPLRERLPERSAVAAVAPQAIVPRPVAQVGGGGGGGGRVRGRRRSICHRRCRWWSARCRCWNAARCSRSWAC